MNVMINTLGPSKLKAGVGNYVYELIINLTRIDTKNNYVIIVNKENKHLFDLQQENVRFIQAPNFTTNRLFRFIWEQIAIPLLCVLNRIDMLHSPGFVAPIFLPCTSIVTVHDTTFFSHPEVHRKFNLFYYTWLSPISCRNASIVIADSENTKKEIIKYMGISERKIKTIYLAANPTCRTVARKKATITIAKKYAIRDPFILFVGTIEPRKNLVRLVESYARAQLQEKLVIVGKQGWMYRPLFQRIQELDLEKSVIFTGFVPDEDLPYFYSAAEVFVYPSLYEGFGIPPLEALHCGCPVITSNISSLPEVVGEAAVLIDPAKDFSAELSKLIQNKAKRNELRRKGFEQAKKFSWKTCAQQTLAIYTQQYKRTSER